MIIFNYCLSIPDWRRLCLVVQIGETPQTLTGGTCTVHVKQLFSVSEFAMVTNFHV